MPATRPTPRRPRKPRPISAPRCESGTSRREAWLALPAHRWLTVGALAVAPYQQAKGSRAVEVLGVIRQVGEHPWRDEEIPRVVYLQPQGGGIEWLAPVDQVKQPPAALAATTGGR